MRKLADVGEDGAAFLDRGDDAGEVVVEQHHVGGLARHVGAAAAHGDADVGLPQGRRVVDAVASHGDELALLFQRADDAHFLFGEDAREHDFRGVERELELDVREMPSCSPVITTGAAERTSPISRAIAVAVWG